MSGGEGFFWTGKGKSMGRLLAFLTVLTGLCVGFYPLIVGGLTMENVWLSLGLVALGLVGKTVGKKLE